MLKRYDVIVRYFVDHSVRGEWADREIYLTPCRYYVVASDSVQEGL